MIGTDANTGKALAGLAHLRQSIRDILTTPIGTRVLNREYGSRLFELVDAPMNADLKVQIFSATADALAKWEPRIKINRIAIESFTAGQIVLSLNATYTASGDAVLLDGIIIT